MIPEVAMAKIEYRLLVNEAEPPNIDERINAA